MLIKCIPYNPGLKGKTVKLNTSKLHFTKRNIIGMIVLRLAEKSLYAVKYRRLKTNRIATQENPPSILGEM
jgi:hypothetical protein